MKNDNNQFDDIVKIIEGAYRKVNEELILFLKIIPTWEDFICRGLYRMKQFYELYKDDEKYQRLCWHNWVGQNHLKIMSGSKKQGRKTDG